MRDWLADAFVRLAMWLRYGVWNRGTITWQITNP